MKLLPASLAALLATSALAAAAPPEAAPAQAAESRPAPSARHLDLARQFVALTFSADDYVGMMRASAVDMAATLSESLGDGDEDPAVNEMMQRTFEQIEPKVRAHMPKLADAYSRAYARAYSEAELLELIAFAQSSAGRRYMTGNDGFAEDPAVREAQDLARSNLLVENFPCFVEWRVWRCMAGAMRWAASHAAPARASTRGLCLEPTR